MSPSPILRLQPFETLMTCLFVLFSVFQRRSDVFFHGSSQLVTWLQPIQECVNCPVSSGLGRGGCLRTRHIYSIVPNPTGSNVFFNPSPISWVLALDSILCPDTRCHALLCLLRRGCVACKNACLGCRMQITSCVPALCNVFLKARMHVLVTEHLMCYGTQSPVLLCCYMRVRVSRL